MFRKICSVSFMEKSLGEKTETKQLIKNARSNCIFYGMVFESFTETVLNFQRNYVQSFYGK